MKILALTKYFPPEIGTASHLFFDLCETLVKRGHQVSVITSIPWYNLEDVDPRYQGRFVLDEEMAGIKVLRIANPPLPGGTLKLRIGHVLVPPLFCLGGWLKERHDVIIVYSPPLLMGLTAQFFAKLWGVPFIFNAQDLYPQCLIDLGQLRSRSIIWFFEQMEAYIYRQASLITVHSHGNRDFLTFVKGVPSAKVRVAHNWVDTDLIQPSSKDNEFARQHNLNGKFVVSFAGTMGISQGIVSVIKSAQYLRAYSDIVLLLVGGGVDKDKAVRTSQDLKVTNVQFLPMQPRELYTQVLAASDVCLVPLRKDIKTPVVPSKILSIMAAGRAVLASLPLEGDAPKIIQKARCGLCVDPEDPQILAEAILKFYRDPNWCAKAGFNGRRYVEQKYSREACVNFYEALCNEVINTY